MRTLEQSPAALRNEIIGAMVIAGGGFVLLLISLLVRHLSGVDLTTVALIILTVGAFLVLFVRLKVWWVGL